MKRFLSKVLWLWTPEYDPGPEVVEEIPEEIPEPVSGSDELSLIRLQIRNLETQLQECRIREEEYTRALMAERAEVVMEKAKVFAGEIREGNAQTHFYEFKKALNEFKATGSSSISYLAKREDLLGPDRPRRAFWISFMDKMAKPQSDFGTALEYIAQRRKESNPFTKKGIL